MFTKYFNLKIIFIISDALIIIDDSNPKCCTYSFKHITYKYSFLFGYALRFNVNILHKFSNKHRKMINVFSLSLYKWILNAINISWIFDSKYVKEEFEKYEILQFFLNEFM